MSAAIEVSGLRKSYGELEAVKGLDLEVAPGECFAFLGPNGAGKTTTVEILEGYRRRSGGVARVLGVDPQDFGRREREQIGVVLQSCEVQPEFTVGESLRLYAGYYPDPLPVERVLGLVGLVAEADQRAKGLSGGQKRRLDVGLALIGNPRLIFLDEPTTGFDPSARRIAWEVIEGLKELGKTVFLTTHYMDEAQRLADRVAVISSGRIIAEGDPATIGGRDLAEATISFSLPPDVDVTAIGDLLHGKPEMTATGLRVRTGDPVPALHRLTGWAIEQGIDLHGLEVLRPTLEDAYLELLGPEADENGGTGS